MSPTPPIARRMNHVAYVTFDMAATVRFYTEVLGLPLVEAIQGSADPATGGGDRHLHVFFAMSSGEAIAFFEIERTEPPPRDRLPRWARHIALEVESRDALAAWQAHLERHGVEVIGPVDHDGTWLSIYFADPNGITLELTHQARPIPPEGAERARRLVAAWTAAHRPPA